MPTSYINDRAAAALFHRFWEGGKANELEFDNKGIPKAELERAVEVEYEHTPDIVTSAKIGDDHFAELGGSYYIGLDLMERVIERGMLGELLQMVRQILPVRTNDLIARLKRVNSAGG